MFLVSHKLSEDYFPLLHIVLNTIRPDSCYDTHIIHAHDTMPERKDRLNFYPYAAQFNVIHVRFYHEHGFISLHFCDIELDVE